MRTLLIRTGLVGLLLVAIVVVASCTTDQTVGEAKAPDNAASPVTALPAYPPPLPPPTERPSGALTGLVYADDVGLHVVTDGAAQALAAWSSLGVHPAASAVALSPDGTQLTYSRTGKDLWLLDLASGESIPLLSQPLRAEHAYILSVKWSPNGDWLALRVGVFHVDGRPAPELNTLFTMAIQEGRTLELETGVNDFTWLPSGEQIVIEKVGGEGETAGLVLAQADGSDRRWLPQSPQGGFAVSRRDGSLVVATVSESKERVLTLYLVGPDGSTEDLLRDYRGPTDLRATNYPSWSPDGTRIAFFSCEPLASSPQGCTSTLFVIDVPTRTVSQLAAGVRPPFAWSPDGQAVAVKDAGAYVIYKVTLNGEVTKWFAAPHLRDGPFEWR